VIAHGLPRPRNLEVGRELEQIVRAGGAAAATIAVIDGEPTIGLEPFQIDRIATEDGVAKLSTLDLPVAVARGMSGGTTVAATARLAHRAGIAVFATGGIGGVHRGRPVDISADLTELSRTPIIVVCAGAKSILDLAATREALETLGILVIGWRTNRFPAFYTRDSGLGVDTQADDAAEIAAIWKAHRRTGGTAAMVVCAPVPAEFELDPLRLEAAVATAVRDAASAGIGGKEMTPYLLREIGRVTDGSSLEANVALLRNNAAIAAQVAREVCGR
jgi:pseudouridine-5'-phosphate glycosidase